MAELSLESGARANLRHDVPAGVVVFLVALPLCLGIALASGAPLFAGLIAGIVGGTVVALLSGSEISVSGPAAGLAVIVAGAIASLGDFRTFLTAVVLSGAIQVGFAFMRGGVIADYVPNCVIKGMLAAIGIVIMLKQIPHALGYDRDFIGDFQFLQRVDERNSFGAIVYAVFGMRPEAAIIAGVSLVILILWQTKFFKGNRVLAAIPAPLLVVVAGIALNEGFRRFLGDFHLKAEDGHLVSLPVPDSLAGLLGQFSTPNWSALGNKQVYIVALTLALVGSLESLLSLQASERIDPFKRLTKPNRELFAQGIGNALSGLVGGLPVTSVVVRTSANVFAGGRTRMAAMYHGVLLLGAVLLVPSILNRIPLASLAAILLLVGYKLADVKLFKEMYRGGTEQFLPFIVTVVAIVFTDLLIGIGIGLAVGLFFVIRANHHSAMTVVSQDNYYLLRFNKDVSFVNKSELKGKLRSIPDGSNLIVDGTKALFIDRDIFEVIEEFQASAVYRNISVETKHCNAKNPPPFGAFKVFDLDGRLQEATARK